MEQVGLEWYSAQAGAVMAKPARVPCCFNLLPLPRFHTALLFVLVIFKPEGTHPPGVRFQGQGAQYVAQTAPSPSESPPRSRGP